MVSVAAREWTWLTRDRRKRTKVVGRRANIPAMDSDEAMVKRAKEEERKRKTKRTRKRRRRRKNEVGNSQRKGRRPCEDIRVPTVD